MQMSLSSNGHEKTKETSKYKKLLISKRRIGILKKLPKQGEDIVRVCDFIIFEIPILTVEMIIVVDHTLSYCQNRDLKYNKITNSHYLHLV